MLNVWDMFLITTDISGTLSVCLYLMKIINIVFTPRLAPVLMFNSTALAVHSAVVKLFLVYLIVQNILEKMKRFFYITLFIHAHDVGTGWEVFQR